MSLRDDMRSAISQAEYNRKFSGLVALEVLAISGCVAVRFQSWVVFFLIFVLLALLLRSPLIGGVFNLFFSGFWTWIAFSFARGIELGATTSMVIAVFVFLFSFGAHSGSLEWHRDV